MGKKYKHLIRRIADPDNLVLSAYQAKKGNTKSVGGMVFMDYLEPNIARMSTAILSNTYIAGKPKRFVIYEPKRREISALPFRDRVTQHAIHNVIEPIFNKTFFEQSYGCIKGKGTHAGAIKCQATMRRLLKQGDVWVLKTDFAGYFYNIDREILFKQYRAKISCEPTLDLIKQYIPEQGTGIQIGYLLSQLSANIYGTIIDHWLIHNQKITDFIRYMDDIVIFGKTKKELIELKNRIEIFCRDEMKLRLSHWSVTPAHQGVNFLGYRIFPTHKLMRRQSVVTAKRKIKRYTERQETEKLKAFLGSWLGHARWADSKNLINKLEMQLCKANQELLIPQQMRRRLG